MKEEKVLYTVKEVASLLGVNVHFVYELIKKGLLPAMKLGSIKVKKESLEKFLCECEGKDLSDLDNIKDMNIA